MKFTTAIVSLLSLALVAAECSAQPPGRQRGDKGKAAAGQRGMRKPGEQGQRPGGRGQGGESRDPAQMVARMMKEFDKDGDSKLDMKELTALMTAMRDRRGSAGDRRGPEQKPEGAGKGQGKPGGGKGQKGKGGGTATPGGEKPKRPSAD